MLTDSISALYTKTVANLIFPLHERLKSHDTVRIHRHMERSQWHSRDQIEALQLERLRAFLGRIAHDVPYFQELFNERKWRPEDVRDLGFLAELPFQTKSVIRDNTERLKSRKAQGLQRFNTGGSSGEPLVFFIGNERVSHDVAAKWRATRWWDVDIGDSELVVWGSPIELGAQDRVRAIRDKLLRTELLPAFEMSEQNLDHFVERIRARRPKMLFGYPSSLAHIVKHAASKGIELNKLGIKVAFVTSERLYDHQRETIEVGLGCPVANGYGGRDAGFIAHQCPAGGMHITAEDIIVEIVGPNDEVLADGQTGEVVITHLATSDFPFVRYRTGDIATRSTNTCDCGRGLPLLADIQGRSTDFIVAKDGTVMHGLALIYVLRDRPEVENFKIVQENLNLTRIELQAGPGYDESANVEIRNEFKRRLGNEVEIEIERVDRIEKEKSGKFRYVISKVAV